MADPEPFPTIQVGETVVRHCRSGSQMRQELKKAHYKLFMPPLNLQLSVVRDLGLTDEQVEAIGRAHVSPEVRGHASVGVLTVRGQNLSIEADPDPHARHANIVGWADDAEVNRLKARALAEASQLVSYAATS